ncbi:MAG: hypothetical protein ACPGVU_26720 [Limisphaerales bacterium]
MLPAFYMTRAILILAAGLVFTACRTTQGEKAEPQPDPGAETTEVTPVVVYQGRIAFIKAAAKYVVVEGGVGEVPPVNTTLNVYRGEQKVGELKTTTQVRSSNYAADILSGTPQVGDTVRGD